MKIAGQTIEGPKPEVVVIPRGGQDYVFKAKAVLNFDEFEKVCPTPTPPEVIRPGVGKSQDTNSPKYQEALQAWSERRVAWMFLESLSATDGLEWESVDMMKPETWKNFEEELNVNFTPGEVSKITEAVMTACGLNQEKIDEATKRFLAIQAQV